MDHGDQQPRKKYKIYGEPENADVDLPRSTVYRLEAGEKEHTVLQGYCAQNCENEINPVSSNEQHEGEESSEDLDMTSVCESSSNTDEHLQREHQEEHLPTFSPHIPVSQHGSDLHQNNNEVSTYEHQMLNPIFQLECEEQQADATLSDASFDLIKSGDHQRSRRPQHKQSTSIASAHIIQQRNVTVLHQTSERASEALPSQRAEEDFSEHSFSQGDEDHDFNFETSFRDPGPLESSSAEDDSHSSTTERSLDSNEEFSGIEDENGAEFGLYDSDSLSDISDRGADTEEVEEIIPQNLAQTSSQNTFLEDQLQKGNLREIQSSVVATKSEILLNALEFSKHHCLTAAALEDLHKLINTIFSSEIIPDTRYKIDQLYSSTSHVCYIFFCKKCCENFGTIDHKLVKEKVCDNCQTINSLSDLTKASFFVIIDIVKQLELLLNEPGVAQQLGNPHDLCGNGEILRDLYDGDMYRKFAASLDRTENCSFLSFTMSTDGSPPFGSSSSLSIWPVFLMVNELPPHLRMTNVLLTALWFGREHPKMDLYLDGVTDYLTSLCKIDGFSMNINNCKRNFKAYIIACCVDSGARGSVQCIHSHNGAYPCNWCLHPGEVEGDGSNARKFRMLDPPPEKRSMSEIIRDGKDALSRPGKNVHVNGVLGITPMCKNPKFDVVDGMNSDKLHWAALGVAKRLCKVWLGETKKKKTNDLNTSKPMYYVGTEENKKIMNSRINSLRPPKEVRRMPRDLSMLSQWNGREWENFILYYSIPVFKNILPDRYLNHWALFVQAFYLLVKAEVSRSEIDAAEKMLFKFVSQVEELYGLKELTYNVHISLHAADSVRRWGPLCYISTFIFENAIGNLKKKIKAERGIPHQILKSFSEDYALRLLRISASTISSACFKEKLARKKGSKTCIYVDDVQCISLKTFTREELSLCDRENILPVEHRECKKIIVNHVCYSLNSRSKTCNSFALLKDGKIVLIRKIIVSEGNSKVFVFMSRVRCSPFMVPRMERSNFSPFAFMVELIENEIDVIRSTSLQSVCVHLSINCRYFVGDLVCMLPNQINVV